MYRIFHAFTANTEIMEDLSPVTAGLFPVVAVGKYFGLIPLNRYPQTTKSKLLMVYNMYTLFANSLIFGFAIVLFFRDILSVEGSNLVEQFLDMVYHCHILITISSLMVQTKELPNIFRTWDKLETLLRAMEADVPQDRITCRKSPYSHPSNSFPEYAIQVLQMGGRGHWAFLKICNLLTSLYVLVVFVGAVSYFITISIKEDAPDAFSYFEEAAKVYVIEEAVLWWIGIYIVILGHTMELIWAFGDMLIFSVSMTLWYQFKRFNKIVRKLCERKMDARDMEDLRIVHWEMAKATKKTNKMLSILTTTVFVCNILYLFSRVFNGIEEDLRHPNWFINFEAVYAFSYLIMRIFSTAIIATKFALETTKSFNALVLTYSAETKETEYLLIDRFCTQVLTYDLSISGSGYFYLNKGFIATLISALLSYEVVILQFSAATRTKQLYTNTSSINLGE